MTDEPTGGLGLPVDRLGNPTIDPTLNVKELIDLQVRRLNDLRDAESRHVREMADLRADCAAELREAETKRIDAVRTVDVQAVQQAATVQATQANTLAVQVATSAETLRTQVAAAASAAAVALAAALEPIQKDIQDLRRVQYEQQGQRAGVSEQTVDRRAGTNIVIYVVMAVIAAFSLLVTIGALAYAASR